jgi:hypothetical protein
MGRIRRHSESCEIHAKFWSVTPDGRDYLGYVIVDRMVILKRTLGVVRNCVDLIAVFYEYYTEPLSCIQAG